MKILSLSLLAVFVCVNIAFAATFMAKENFTVKDEIPNDAYLAGQQININNQINGDLIAVGGDILINADVAGDVNIAGGQISVLGNIGDDARMAGGKITIKNSVQGDVIIFGGDVAIENSAVIDGDLIVRAGNIIMSGLVKGKMNTASSSVIVNGAIEGNTKIEAGTISFGQNAKIGGNLEYSTNQAQLDLSETQVAGQIIYHQKLTKKTNEKEENTFKSYISKLTEHLGFFIYSILSAILLLIIITTIDRSFFTEAAKKLNISFSSNIPKGLLYFIATPIVGFLFMVTIIGLPIGIFIIAVYTFTIYLAKVVTAITLAKLIDTQHKMKWSKGWIFFISLLLFIALKVIAFLPIIGWIINLVIICAAFGALIETKMERVKKVL
ncbi:MAG: hypothetical protein UR28_C0030G0014 [Candidatus Peregrinibacteria bacterium GW2011_GWF2_33_10]|nr:MAG: hypothetical protein UR28_C0030G0014 [Candidatus Peregrinibacteria bacterium GW2011_GWF2_33_10]